MARERPGFVSEERIKELAKNFSIDEKLSYMSLDLGVKHGLESGYPVLRLMKLSRRPPYDIFIFEAAEPAPNDPGYERPREPTKDEISTFIKVARLAAPEARMTKVLYSESIKLLAAIRGRLESKMKEEQEEVDSINNTLEILEVLRHDY